jgi:hypothetical protein
VMSLLSLISGMATKKRTQLLLLHFNGLPKTLPLLVAWALLHASFITNEQENMFTLFTWVMTYVWNQVTQVEVQLLWGK